MLPILIILLILLVPVALALHRRPRALARKSDRSGQFEHQAGGLFDIPYSVAEQGYEGRVTPADDERGALVARARRGDKGALTAARQSKDASVYGEVLDGLVAQASEESLQALAQHIIRSGELRASARMAERMIEAYRSAPESHSTADLLHIAALSDDADIYQMAIETVFRLWREGHLSTISAKQLRESLKSEYWVLASEARSSGAGFALRRKLAVVCRQLAAARQPSV